MYRNGPATCTLVNASTMRGGASLELTMGIMRPATGAHVFVFVAATLRLPPESNCMPETVTVPPGLRFTVGVPAIETVLPGASVTVGSA